MRLASALLPIAGLVAGLSGPVCAQDSDRTNCRHFDRMVAAAPDRFQSMRGAEIQPSVFSSTVALPGYEQCSIVDAPDMAFLLCFRPVSPGMADFFYQVAAADVRRCAAGWPTQPVEKPVDELRETVDGVRFVQQTSKGEVSAGVLLGREKSDEESDEIYLVSVGFGFRPLAAAS